MSLPILRLRVSGYCCVMLNEEDKLIYYGASALQSLPITWYRKVKLKQPKQSQQNEPSTAIKEGTGNTTTTTALTITPTPTPPVPEKKSSRPLLKPQASVSLVDVIFPQGEGGGDRNRKSGNNTNDQYSYVGIDANLSICDTDAGPAIEVRSTNSKETLEILEKYDIVDFDQSLDSICNYLSINGGYRNADGVGGNDSGEEKEHIIQRTVLLSITDCAAAGGKWELANMLQVGSGNFECGIKVYQSASDFQLLGAGKKVLLFDILKSCSLPKEDVISYINALVKWDADRRSYAAQTAEDGIGEICLKMPNWCC